MQRHQYPTDEIHFYVVAKNLQGASKTRDLTTAVYKVVMEQKIIILLFTSRCVGMHWCHFNAYDNKFVHIHTCSHTVELYLIWWLCIPMDNKVTIIEASNRIGGRVETFRNIKEGWYAELGAMRIPSFHKWVKKWLDSQMCLPSSVTWTHQWVAVLKALWSVFRGNVQKWTEIPQ